MKLRAPAAPPRAVARAACAAGSRARGGRGRSAGRSRRLPISSSSRPVRSSVGGSIIASMSANGMRFRNSRVVVGVERAPAAVAALHAERPVRAGGERAALRRDVGHGDALQHHQDHGRVVDVGIPVVGELERPAARLEVGVAARSSRRARRSGSRSASPRRAPARGDRPGMPGVEQRLGGERRVPGRRHARLEEELAVVLDHEVLDRLDALARPPDGRPA